MAVQPASAYGAIFRKTAHTRPLMRDWRLSERASEEDEWLRALCLGGSGEAVGHALAELETAGFVRGRDFVLTVSSRGVVDDLPDWLVSKTPTDAQLLVEAGFSDGLWAKYDDSLKAQWLESLRRSAYRYADIDAA
jgi:hypothetical protein